MSEEKKTAKVGGDKVSKATNSTKTKSTPKKTNKQDSFGRFILPVTFENLLHQGTNSLKLAYSALKNVALSYRQVSAVMEDEQEAFWCNNDCLFFFRIEDNTLQIYLPLRDGYIDNELYPYIFLKDTPSKTHPMMVVINDLASQERGADLIALIMSERNIALKSGSLPIAYAEQYPFMADAVLKGREDISPEHFTGKEYDNIRGELSSNLMRQAQREDSSDGAVVKQSATTLKGAIALAEPIIYFYDVVSDDKNGNAFIFMQQVLNDKFLGKLLPHQFFAIAENSGRISELNLLQLSAINEDCVAYPNLLFAMNVSIHLLLDDEIFSQLLEGAFTPNENLMLAFDSAMINAAGDKGKKALAKLKEAGIKLMLNNAENASMTVLTECFLDYLRLDSRYYDSDNPKTIAHLDLITQYCLSQGIITVADNVQANRQAMFLFSHGVDCIQGEAVSSPHRQIQTAIRRRKNLPIKSGG